MDFSQEGVLCERTSRECETRQKAPAGLKTDAPGPGFLTRDRSSLHGRGDHSALRSERLWEDHPSSNPRRA